MLTLYRLGTWADCCCLIFQFQANNDLNFIAQINKPIYKLRQTYKLLLHSNRQLRPVDYAYQSLDDTKFIA